MNIFSCTLSSHWVSMYVVLKCWSVAKHKITFSLQDKIGHGFLCCYKYQGMGFLVALNTNSMEHGATNKSMLWILRVTRQPMLWYLKQQENPCPSFSCNKFFFRDLSTFHRPDFYNHNRNMNIFTICKLIVQEKKFMS